MLRFHLPHDCDIDILPESEIPALAESKESKPIAFVSSTARDFQLYRLDSAKHIIEFKLLNQKLTPSLTPSKAGVTVFADENKLICIHSPTWVDMRMEILCIGDDSKLLPLSLAPSSVEMGDQIIQSNIIAKNANYWLTENPDLIFVTPRNTAERPYIYNLKTGLVKFTLLIEKPYFSLPDGRLLDMSNNFTAKFDPVSGNRSIVKAEYSWLKVFNPITNTAELFLNKYDIDLGFATMLGSDTLVCQDGFTTGKTLLVFNTSDLTKPTATIPLDKPCQNLKGLGNNHLIVNLGNNTFEVFERKENEFIKTQSISDALIQLNTTNGIPEDSLCLMKVIGHKHDNLILFTLFLSNNLISCWRINKDGRLQNTSSAIHTLTMISNICDLGHFNQFIVVGKTQGNKEAAMLWDTELQSCLYSCLDIKGFATFLSDGRCIIRKDYDIHLLDYTPFVADKLEKCIEDSVPKELASAGKNKNDKGLTGIILSYLFCPERKAVMGEEFKTDENVVKPTL